MSAHPVLEDILAAVGTFRGDYRIAPREMTKFTGAITIEVIRKRLLANSICVSCRDAFIRGIPIELDLLVCKPVLNGEIGPDYAPENVLAALEIKYSGVYSQQVIPRLKMNFDRIKSRHPHVCCLYITVMEDKKFKYLATSQALGHEVFTLNWYDGGKNRHLATQSSDWDTLLSKLKDLSKTAP